MKELTVALCIIIVLLLMKIVSMHHSMDKISRMIENWLQEDTNALITVETRDRHIRNIADTFNHYLRKWIIKRQKYVEEDRKLKEAVTNISHDLRTPLTAIKGYLELIRAEQKSKKAAQYLEIIENRAEAMQALTEDLFQYTIITADTIKPNFTEVSLNAVLADAIAGMYTQIKNKGISPEINIPEQEIICLGDAKLLLRIYSNILENAVKYSAGDLDIQLKDNGTTIFANGAPSLDEVQVGKLFDRFYTVTNASHSTGIGLSIAKELTQQMSGQIFAEYKNGMLYIYVCFGIKGEKK